MKSEQHYRAAGVSLYRFEERDARPSFLGALIPFAIVTALLAVSIGPWAYRALVG